MSGCWRELLPFFPGAWRGICEAALAPVDGVEEIRARQGLPLGVVYGGGDGFISPGGELLLEPAAGYRPDAADLAQAVQLCTRNSLYAWEEEIRSGFITLPGGHRVGLAGRAVLEDGRVRLIKPVVSLNYRVAREIRGAADRVVTHVINPAARRVCHTLIASPPQGGKTTLLRDLVRQLSTGIPSLRWRGVKVALVDERSEVAGAQAGVPRLDVGTRTDVLDACPKAWGIMLAIRSLSPEVVAVDELGREEDALAVEEALRAGVSVLATAHGSSREELVRRPGLSRLLANGAFERLIILGRSHGPGTVERVTDLGAATPAVRGHWGVGPEALGGLAVHPGSRGYRAGGGP